jgi:hypothetical protein
MQVAVTSSRPLQYQNAAGAPVWKMDTFRDRFLAAFGPPAHTR